MNEARERLHRLLRSFDSICIGYSGGVDSAFLAVSAAHVLGPDRVLAVTGVSPSVSAAQLDAARRIAATHGVPHLEIATDELNDPRYAANAPNRCYFCKSELWTKLTQVAAERGFAVLADGTNADDVGDHRPGMQAGRENAVRSPLKEAGLTKAVIRALSRELDLETWDAPAAPCLASRVQHGLAVTVDRLRQIEQAEAAIAALGFREYRVRHHGDVARLEFDEAETSRALACADRIVAGVRAAGFERVGIDVHGYRRGSLHRGAFVQLNPAPEDRSTLAREMLSAAGIRFDRAECAGVDEDVLWVRAPLDARASLANVAPELRAVGLKWVALEPLPSAERRTA